MSDEPTIPTQPLPPPRVEVFEDGRVRVETHYYEEPEEL